MNSITVSEASVPSGQSPVRIPVFGRNAVIGTIYSHGLLSDAILSLLPPARDPFQYRMELRIRGADLNVQIELCHHDDVVTKGTVTYTIRQPYGDLLDDMANLSPRMSAAMKRYCPKLTTLEHAIRHYGKRRVLHCGQPSPMADTLLRGMWKAQPPPSLNARLARFSRFAREEFFSMVHSGLLVRTQEPIPGRQRGGWSTSEIGVGLLRHWAGRSKKFKQFFDAYSPAKPEERARYLVAAHTLLDKNCKAPEISF